MAESNSKKPAKKKGHPLRKLVGTVVVAGATYAVEKMIESRRNKKALKKKKESS
ncbi:MAG: hypothetical protein WCV86_02135 [Patescibacteria group bacterium]|jgi:hypothetical protein